MNQIDISNINDRSVSETKTTKQIKYRLSIDFKFAV